MHRHHFSLRPVGERPWVGSWAPAWHGHLQSAGHPCFPSGPPVLPLSSPVFSSPGRPVGKVLLLLSDPAGSEHLKSQPTCSLEIFILEVRDSLQLVDVCPSCCLPPSTPARRSRCSLGLEASWASVPLRECSQVLDTVIITVISFGHTVAQGAQDRGAEERVFASGRTWSVSLEISFVPIPQAFCCSPC